MIERAVGYVVAGPWYGDENKSLTEADEAAVRRFVATSASIAFFASVVLAFLLDTTVPLG